MSIDDSARILGVSAHAKIGDVKDAYRRLARLYHPDHQSSAEMKELAEAKLKELNLAYEVFKEREEAATPNQSTSTTNSDRAPERPKAKEDDTPAFDIIGFWREVESVRVPRFRYSRPAPQTHSVSPTPLSPSAIPGKHPPIQRTIIQKAVGWIAVAAVILMIPQSSRLFGLNIAATFSVWWCIYEWLALRAFDADNQPWFRARSELKAEHSYRERVRRNAISQIESAEVRSRDFIERIASEFGICLTQLQELKNYFAELEKESDAEIQRKVRKDYDRALDQFLASHCLRDFKLNGIGPGRLAQLESLGIVTAADIEAAVTDGIPGFGPALIETLISFRDFVVSRFQYTPDPDAPFLTDLLCAIFEAQTTCQLRMQDRLRDLRELSQKGQAELESLNSRIRELLTGLAQADADAAISKNALKMADAHDLGWLSKLRRNIGTPKQKAFLVVAGLCLAIISFLTRPRQQQQSTFIAASPPENQTTRDPVITTRDPVIKELAPEQSSTTTMPSDAKPSQQEKSPEQPPPTPTKEGLELAKDYRKRGTQAFDAENYDAAVQLFSSAVLLDGSESSYDHRAVANFYARNHEDAVADCAKVIEMNPRNAAAFYLRGLCYRRLQKQSEADSDIARASELDSTIIERRRRWEQR